ncbi:MAG TPA: DUF4367 domain-containing protein [Bacillota bacterium]|jgi:hypothetical protein|nr:DUF4367 domain-containing protein [Bacillota bacterium]HQE65527.1 DUF4367 domain-containing protein [Bacillota bacterium]HQI15688.1 DUF4367 domain-containing protein [Bacillota bacterium]HQJ36656.1 DUF4367 domain-containing protein [Bacillota bacterium]HQL35723.1 DUF4367 domain-containing protein [Bacillota bacterium]
MKNEFDYLNNVKVDFSGYELVDLTDLERMKMKSAIVKDRNRFLKRAVSVAACLAIIVTLNQSVSAQSIINDIVKSISTGFNNFIQVDDANIGLNIGNEDDSSLSVKISNKQKEDPIAAGSNNEKLIITAEKEINDHLNFEAKLPSYLPDGYAFYGAELFKNGNGAVSGDYLTIHYKNHTDGKLFVVLERILNSDTAYTLATDGPIEEVNVNGCKAVLQDNRTLSWETGNISVTIAGREALAGNELFKVAESVK